MNKIDINEILQRKIIEKSIKDKLKFFQDNCNDCSIKRGFYIYGNSGVGKTEFIKNILRELDYEIILYDSGDIRNKSIINSITSKNITNKSIYSMFQKKIRKIAIIMDEIDGMNNGDKGGISSLIKLVRPKKTKKQKLENTTMNPIICIGNYHIDKKINELKKVTNVYELKKPTNEQIYAINKKLMPTLDNETILYLSKFIDGDLRKINTCLNIYDHDKNILIKKNISDILHNKINNDYIKDITKNLLHEHIPLNKHNIIMNETDRTIVSLLFHENIVDNLTNSKDVKSNINFYLNTLQYYTNADYIDRVTFQKQIWVFNEISSLMKTIRINNEYIDYIKKNNNDNYNRKEIRFTKILTKYSTEYNNMLFIQGLCNNLQIDKKDLLDFFSYLKNKYTDNKIIDLFETYNISKLDINRIYRYIDNL